MEMNFKYNLVNILQEVNGEPDLIPYWIKLDLMDRNVPITIDPTNIKDDVFSVEVGYITYNTNDYGFLNLIWTVNKS
jgi:hypothetical protein